MSKDVHDENPCHEGGFEIATTLGDHLRSLCGLYSTRPDDAEAQRMFIIVTYCFNVVFTNLVQTIQ